MKREFISTSSEQTKEIAKKVLTNLDGNIVVLTGDLGSGKTTFSQGVGQSLNVNRIISPTYIMLRQYNISNNPRFTHLYHADLYRVKTAKEALDLGLSEIWSDPNNLLLIEWPEIILDLLPKNITKINFKKLEEDQRRITIT